MQDVSALIARLDQLEAEVRRLRKRRAVATLFAVACLGVVGTALAANGNCPNGLPFCFSANSPALASEVNHNFSQVKEWLEAKVGAVGAPVTVSGATTVSTTSLSTTSLTTSSISVTGTASTAAVSTGTLSATGASTFADVTLNGAVTDTGFQTTCAETEPGWLFPYCCRINVRTGATSCRISTNSTFSAVGGNPVGPFGATTPGRYSLSCMRGVNNANFPGCCRTNQNTGTVECAFSNNWQLTSWTSALAIF